MFLFIGDLVLLKSGHSNSGASMTTASETIDLSLRLLAPLVELIDSDVSSLWRLRFNIYHLINNNL